MKTLKKLAVTSIMTIVATMSFASAAETQTYSIPAYHTTANGFVQEEENVVIGYINVDNTNLYSLSDILEVIDSDNYTVTSGYSERFFRGSYYDRIYNVDNLVITDGTDKIELLNKKYILNDGSTQYVDYITYDIIDNEIYVSDVVIKSMFDNNFVYTNNGVTCLTNTDEDFHFFKKNHGFTDEQKDNITSALFVLFNTYTDGYNSVMTNVGNLRGVTQSYLDYQTGVPGCSAGAMYHTSNIILVKDVATTNDLFDIAALLTHEAQHLYRFQKYDYSETYSVLEQIKCLYYMDDCGYMDTDEIIDSLLNIVYPSLSSSYNCGINKANAWLNEQASIDTQIVEIATEPVG